MAENKISKLRIENVPYNIIDKINEPRITSLETDLSSNYFTKTDIEGLKDQLVKLLNTKQDLLVSTENIKTINNQSIIGEGNLQVTALVDQPSIINALGYTPYDSANPQGFISSLAKSDVTSALGYTPYNVTNPSGYLNTTTLTDQVVKNALGYTPYDSTNPDGYISGITQTDVTRALGYTPYNSSNPNNFVTKNVSDLANYYNKTAIDALVGASFKAEIVAVLPASGISTSTIYMVRQSGSTTENPVYDEYMYINNKWEKIGTTNINLSEYAKINDLAAVAITGSYASLENKPVIPTLTSDLVNDSGFITNTTNSLLNYTTTANLSEVALTGSYQHLTNKPTIPSSLSQLSDDVGYVTTNDLSSIDISTFVNDIPYAKMSDIEALEELDVEEIKRAIAATEHIGTVTEVHAGTGLTGGGNVAVTLNHSNAVTAKTAFGDNRTALSNGGTLTVTDIKYDAEGHVTASQDRTIQMEYIAPYNDAEVKQLISTETATRQLIDSQLSESIRLLDGNYKCILISTVSGNATQYIDPETLQPVEGRYYTKEDLISYGADRGTELSNMGDINVKTYLKYAFCYDTLQQLDNISVYVEYYNDTNEFCNIQLNYNERGANPLIASYPNLEQIGMYRNDGLACVDFFTNTKAGILRGLEQDGYIASNGNKCGYVFGWNGLVNRVADTESDISDIQSTLGDMAELLDLINVEEL